MSATPAAQPVYCPRCDRRLVDEELKETGIWIPNLAGEPGEVMEHTPKRGCGKWFWRPRSPSAETPSAGTQDRSRGGEQSR